MSFPTSKIVVPIDFSGESPHAITNSVKIAGDASKLHLIHVLLPLDAVSPGVLLGDVSDDSRRKTVTEKLNGLAAAHGAAEATVSVLLGTPGMEIADYAKAGIHIDNLSVDRDIQEFYNNLGMDPLGTIASGSLIITVNPKSTEALMSELSLSGIKSTRIGSVVARENGVTISKPGDLSILPLNKFFQDEITNIPV